MHKPITKAEFVTQLADEIQENKSIAANALDAITLIISRELEAGRDVTLPSIGKFKYKNAQHAWYATLVQWNNFKNQLISGQSNSCQSTERKVNK